MKQTKKLSEGIRIAKEGIEECWDDMGGQKMTTGEQGEQMSVTISMPGKNISVTTDSADEIGNILRLAGITLGGDAPIGDVDGDGDHDLTDHAAEVGATEPEVMYVGAMPSTGDEEVQSDDSEEAAIAASSEEAGEEEEPKEATQTPSSWTDKQGEKHPATRVQGASYGNEKEVSTEPKSKKNAILDKDDEVEESTSVTEASGIMISGKEVDTASLQVDGVDSSDYPDFADAYISQASFVDGTDLSDDEMNQLNDQYGELANELAFDSLHESSGEPTESARILQLAGVTNEAQSPAQKAAFKAMIAKKNGDKPAAKSDSKDDNKKPDEDGDGVPDWADKNKEVKEEAPATNSMFGQGVYESEASPDLINQPGVESARILELAGVAESKLMNSPSGTSMPEPKVFDKLPSADGQGAGHKDYGQNRANNQGENPMGLRTPDISVEEAFQTAMSDYRKFVAENIAKAK